MHARVPLMFTTAIAVTTFSLVLAGCGSSSTSSSTVSGSGGAQETQAHSIQPAVNFSDCMRSHGVPSFPDPTTSPREFKQSLDPSLPHSPEFVTAVKACQHFLIGFGSHSQPAAHSPAQISAMLAFAGCLRSHGFPSFPDPSSGGDLTHQMLASAGIDLHQPAVVQAANACVGVTHGYITKTDVARFIAGQ
jgi:hypothetical protein